MKILITGAAGSIGSELVKQLHEDHTVYAVDINETGINDLYVDYDVVGRVGDIRDYETVNDILADFPADTIYHAAAYKHVEPMEVTPLEAIKTNVLGTYNLLHCARRFEVERFVTISTDKVVNAMSVMGQTKKLAETMTVNQGYSAVRFPNILGSRGSVATIWERQDMSGKPITVTDKKMERYMITIEKAGTYIINAGDTGIWIPNITETVNIYDLAQKMYPGRDIEIIGIRPGEALAEKLMTEEEFSRAVIQGDYYVLS